MDRRYLKRMQAYWRREERSSLAHVSEVARSPWFDYWHTHPDWDGKGNRCIENRIEIARICVGLLEWLEDTLKTRPTPAQCWVELYADSASDSVWLHSPNPNGTAYPREFSGVRWNEEPPGWLAALVPTDRFEIGVRQLGEAPVYVIRPRSQPALSRI